MLAFFALASALLATSVSATNHTVIVGGSAGLKFTPEKLTGEIGDFVTFIFQTKNHTVTQSGFSKPCSLLENATINAVGFDTGFVPVSETDTEFPAWTIELTTKSPLWFYCKQGKHCQQGMVGSINAATTGNKTHEDFVALAKAGGDGAANGTSSALSTAPSVANPTATGVGASGAGTSRVPSSAASAGASGSSLASNTGGARSASQNRDTHTIVTAALALSLVLASSLVLL